MRCYSHLPDRFITETLEATTRLIDLLIEGEQYEHTIPPMMLKRLEGMIPPLEMEMQYRTFEKRNEEISNA